MALKCVLPDPIIRLVLLYEGSVVKAYLICLLRRLNVRCYQRVFSRDFNFYNLKHYCISHLAHLVHTEVFCINRMHGEVTKRVYRKALAPWFPLIKKLKMAKPVHTLAMKIVYGRYRKGHPMYSTLNEVNLVWLYECKGQILCYRIR